MTKPETGSIQTQVILDRLDAGDVLGRHLERFALTLVEHRPP